MREEHCVSQVPFEGTARIRFHVHHVPQTDKLKKIDILPDFTIHPSSYIIIHHHPSPLGFDHPLELVELVPFRI